MKRGPKFGSSNNPHGRPPDSKVKAYREAVRDKSIARVQKLFAALDTLSGKEYIDSYLRIMKDFLPPLASEPDIIDNNKDQMVSTFEKLMAAMRSDNEPPQTKPSGS